MALPPASAAVQPQLGDEVISVAPIDGAREFDDPAGDKIGNALDMKAGRPRRHFKKPRIRFAEIGGGNPLNRTHRAVAGLLQRQIERRVTASGSGSTVAESDARSIASGVSLAMRSRATRATSSWTKGPEPSSRPATAHRCPIEPCRPHGHTPPRHVLGERGKPRKRLLDALHPRRDEGARAMTLNQDAAFHEVLYRFADRNTRNVRLGGDVALRGKRVARTDEACRTASSIVFFKRR